MKKHRFVGFVALAICLVTVLAVVIRTSRKATVYRGQPLQTWTLQAYQGNSNAVAVMNELGTNVIPELMALLKTRDSFVRKQTWRHLPKLPLQLRQNIARRFPPPQAEAFREAAAHALGSLGTDAKTAIPQLARALGDNEGRVRWEAATALGLIGKDSVPTLVNALSGTDAKARHATAYALGQIGPDAADAVPALVQCLNDPDQSVRNSAAYSLTVIGTAGFLALMDAAQRTLEPARTVATRMLTNSYLHHLKASSEFLRMAHDTSPTARRRAIEALGAIRVASGLAVHASLEALNDPALEVRLAAINTLGTRGTNEERASQALTRCLQDDSPRIREAATRALQGLNVQGTN